MPQWSADLKSFLEDLGLTFGMIAISKGKLSSGKRKYLKKLSAQAKRFAQDTANAQPEAQEEVRSELAAARARIIELETDVTYLRRENDELKEQLTGTYDVEHLRDIIAELADEVDTKNVLLAYAVFDADMTKKDLAYVRKQLARLNKEHGIPPDED